MDTIATATPAPKLRQPGGWESVCHDLQQAITLGLFRPRERLVEDEIMARAGATRHAVRRAFVELERLGLVLRLPNRGVRVRDYTLAEIEELYEIRACLERQAAARFAFPAAPDLVAELREIAAAHAEVSRRRAFTRLFRMNNLFHETLYRGAGNASLAEAIRQYTFMTHPIRARAFPNDELREIAIAEHHAMVDAIAAGDRPRLETLVVAHILRPMRFYVACTFEDAAPPITPAAASASISAAESPSRAPSTPAVSAPSRGGAAR